MATKADFAERAITLNAWKSLLKLGQYEELEKQFEKALEILEKGSE